ncbi:MAG: hypothetical protein ABSE53_14090 [Terracidiphilus sp.]
MSTEKISLFNFSSLTSRFASQCSYPEASSQQPAASSQQSVAGGRPPASEAWLNTFCLSMRQEGEMIGKVGEKLKE